MSWISQRPPRAVADPIREAHASSHATTYASMGADDGQPTYSASTKAITIVTSVIIAVFGIYSVWKSVS